MNRALMASVLALAAFCPLISYAAKGDGMMPKAAPDFRANPKPAAPAQRAKTGSDFEGSTFRVRTPAAAPLSGGVRTDAQNPLSGAVQTDGMQPLKGNLDIAKTMPGQEPPSKSVPPAVFRGWLEEAHPQFALNTSQLSARDLLEVKGVYDNSGKTLEALRIPFEHIRTGTLRERSLAGVKVMVIDCPGRVPRESYQKIRDWVAAGGYLLSTDWSGDNAVQPIFPGYIEWTRQKNREAMYPAEIVRPDPVLYKHTVTNANWKMDIDCHLIRILRPDVRVLARAPELAREDPASQGALGVVFPFGRGYVMHLVGHFDNNTALPGRLADAAPVIRISLRQAIATNFVVAGLSGTRIPK